MRSIYLSQAFASEAVFVHLLFAPLCQNMSKPRNLSYFPLKIRSRPKKGENRPVLRTERLGSWVSKIARLGEDTTQKTTTHFCSQMYQPSRVSTLQKHRHPGSLAHGISTSRSMNFELGFGVCLYKTKISLCLPAKPLIERLRSSTEYLIFKFS